MFPVAQNPNSYNPFFGNQYQQTPATTPVPMVQPKVQEDSYLTQSQIINRKSVNGAVLPLYVKIGKAECDSCKIKELIHGYHNDPNTDICTRCFSLGNFFMGSLPNSWVEFNAE